MERGTIDVDDLPGGVDLYATIESGQSYGWRREDGRAYEGHGPDEWGDDSPWYVRVVDGDPVRVRQRDGRLEWEATAPLEPDLRRLLRLDDDLPAILEAAPSDPLLDAAIEYAPGMRLVRDPPFETLVAFICSTQMRVERIHGMVTALSRAYGEAVTVDGRTYHAFPTPEALAAATEAELRDLGLGYRAPYVVETAEMVASGEYHPTDAVGLPYEEAREALTRFVGVGEKVADCVLLFSLDYLQAVPLDTWIQSAIAEHYPDCDRGSYATTSRAIRERFGVLTSEASEGTSDASDGVPPSEARGDSSGEPCESDGVLTSGASEVSGERSEADARQADRPDGGSSGESCESDGGEYAGYVQTYVFHYLRTGGPDGQ